MGDFPSSQTVNIYQAGYVFSSEPEKPGIFPEIQLRNHWESNPDR